MSDLRLFAEVPDRAMAVYAHPDDADVACGATLARWANAGCEVHLVLVADGSKGTSDPAMPLPQPRCWASPQWRSLASLTARFRSSSD